MSDGLTSRLPISKKDVKIVMKFPAASLQNNLSLKAKIQEDMIAAMKARDEVKTGALRMLKAAIMKFEVAGAKKEAGDDEIMGIIGKEVKQRKESAEAFRKGGREDLAVKEDAEFKILAAYLPEQMSEAEVKKVVQEVIGKVGASSAADIGKVMGPVMAQLKGKTDGQMVNKIVRELLGS